MSTISKIGSKLSDPGYRRAYVASQINVGIPFQLRALLKSRGKTQEWLAEKTGMLQPRISGLVTPGKTRPNIETLRRLAEAFDCGLTVRFVPFSELAKWSEGFDPENFMVPDFEHDQGFAEPEHPELRIGVTLRDVSEALSVYLQQARTELPASNQTLVEFKSLPSLGLHKLETPVDSSVGILRRPARSELTSPGTLLNSTVGPIDEMISSSPSKVVSINAELGRTRRGRWRSASLGQTRNQVLLSHHSRQRHG